MANSILAAIAPILSIIVIVALVILAVIVVGKVMYKKAPPNVAMVITGPRGNRVAIGKGCFVIPIIQRVDYMSLENIQSDFTSRDEIPTQDAINILVDAVANVSISQDPERLKIAASKFLGYNPEQIREIITPVFEGNIREIISQTTLKELIQGDKKIFAERAIENVTPNLHDMGLELTTFNIQNFKDKNGVIDNLGLENTVQISKDAAISKAKAEKEIAVAKAEASKAANDAQVLADTEIAKKQNELEIQKAELKKAADIKKAEADAAYQIQEEEQRKTIEITTANANLARQEKEIELKEREVAIKERTLEATVKKEAEARKYAAQQDADARLYETQKASEAELFERQKKAEAEKFEAEQKAEATKAAAEAQKIAMENEAAGIKAKGEAEAAAVQAKALAEAEGILKKAEAMKQYGEAAQMDMQLQAIKTYFEQLPAIAEAAGKAYTNVDKIYMYGGESSNLTSDIMKNVTQVSEGLGESLGIDLKSLLTGVLGAKILGGDKDCKNVTVNVEPVNDIED
jgi:flotillin